MARPQRRSPGVGAVEDLWMRADGEPSSRFNRGRRWRVTVTPPDGDRYSRAFDRKVDAVSWSSDQTTKLNLGTSVNPQHGIVTVSDLYAEWEQQWGHVTANARAKRTSAWNARVSARWGLTAVRDIKPSHVRTWVSELAAAEVSVSSIESAMEVLRPVLALAVEERRIAVNPAAQIKLPKREHSDRGYLTHAQVEELAQAFTRRSDQTFVRFQAYTGLRPGETFALRVSSFNMLRKRVDVRERVAEVSGRLEWGPPKTWERRGVPLPTFLVDEVAELMVGKGRDELVFTAPKGGVVRLDTWRRRTWNSTLKHVQEANAERRANEARAAEEGKPEGFAVPEFPTITPYALRHTAVSLAISAGANVLAVQRMLGHKNAAMTLDTYADLFPDDLELVSGKLCDARRDALNPPAGAPAETTVR